MKLEERHYAETAREYALRMLKENIISMELKPGAMVSENELAAQLGLSRTPVREALMDMAQYGLVDILPQRGSRISLIDYALVEEARFAREVLEVAILSIVCENVTEESLVQLRQNVRFQQLSQEPEMSGTFDLMELDNEFHRLLFHIAHKDNTVRMLEGMMAHFDRVRALSLSVVKDQKIISDHLAICDAIERRDVAAAQALSVKPTAAAAAVERVLGELGALRQRCAKLEESVFAGVAARYAGSGDVLLFEDEMGGESVRRLCDAVAETCGGRCAVFAGAGSAWKYAIGQRGGDLRALTKELNAALSGRGGGKPEFVQGSVGAEREAIEAFFAEK